MWTPPQESELEMVSQDIVHSKHSEVIKELEKEQHTVCPQCKAILKPILSIKDRVKVLIATPSMGKIEPIAFDLHKDFSMYLKELEWKAPLKFFNGSVGDVLTPYARERLAEEAIANGFDYILFIDDDMLFSFDIFERLYKHNVDIVAPLMFTRKSPHKVVAYISINGYDKDRHEAYYKTKFVDDYPKDTLFKCDATGMGICLIKVEAMKKVKPPWFMNTMDTGEDVYFTQKASAAGLGVYMDTSIHNVVHLSERIKVDEAYVEKLKGGKQ